MKEILLLALGNATGGLSFKIYITLSPRWSHVPSSDK